MKQRPRKYKYNHGLSIIERLERLEAEVFQVHKKNTVMLSKEGNTQFPEMKSTIFYFIRRNKNHPEMLMLRRAGRKSIEQYHESFFSSPPVS